MSALPLKAVETDFAVDSTGFSTSRFIKWFNKKYGQEVDNREWVKLHAMWREYQRGDQRRGHRLDCR